MKGRVVDRLRADGHDVVWVREIDEQRHELGQDSLADHEIGKKAAEQGRFIVTEDRKSFLHENFKENQGFPYGVVMLQLHEMSPQERQDRVSNYIRENTGKISNNLIILHEDRERIKTIEQARHDYEKTKGRETQRDSKEDREK